MSDEVSVPRSRRALLAAAAGGAAALAASAALPLSVAAADPNDIAMGALNTNIAITPTSVTNTTTDLTAFSAAALGTGAGLEGTSTGGAGVYAWSISAPPTFAPADGAYTGVFGWSPASAVVGLVGVGVMGQSDDWGVYGAGSVGVYGFGNIGVIGESASGAAGVLAIAQTATDVALDVRGKVRFSRSGRANIAARQSSKVVVLPGVTAGSHILAVMHTNRTGRWVRAVVPAAGRFTIHLNATVPATTSVAWFVIN